MRGITCKTCGQEVPIPFRGEVCPYCRGNLRRVEASQMKERVLKLLSLLAAMVFLMAAVTPWISKDSRARDPIGNIFATVFFLILAAGIILLGKGAGRGRDNIKRGRD